MFFYKKILRPILFAMDPEFVHDFLFLYLFFFKKIKWLNNFLFKISNFTSPKIKQNLWGLYFRTPIGLSAGMDKNGLAANVWSSFGFAWAQIGSVTYEQQDGNPKPRLWRLPKDKSIVIYYGLTNDGAKKISERLRKIQKSWKPRGLLSISIAKSTSVDLNEAATDIAKSFQILKNQGNIITINLSCPNVKNFCGLQQADLLEPILKNVSAINTSQKPIWLKIGIDLSKEELDHIIRLAKQYHIDALIATNLSKDRSKLNLKSKHKDKPGGISGKPIFERSNQVISYLYKNSEGKYKIVGVGGIFDAADAYQKIKAGASLLQIATGFIYGGPMSIKAINKGLDKLLTKDNYKHISEAVGVEADNYNL